MKNKFLIRLVVGLMAGTGLLLFSFVLRSYLLGGSRSPEVALVDLAFLSWGTAKIVAAGGLLWTRRWAWVATMIVLALETLLVGYILTCMCLIAFADGISVTRTSVILLLPQVLSPVCLFVLTRKPIRTPFLKSKESV